MFWKCNNIYILVVGLRVCIQAFFSHNGFQYDLISSSFFFSTFCLTFLPSFTTSFDLIAFIQIGFSFQLVAHIHSTTAQLKRARERETDWTHTKKKNKNTKVLHASEFLGTVYSHSPKKKQPKRLFVAHKFHGNDFRIILISLGNNHKYYMK